MQKGKNSTVKSSMIVENLHIGEIWRRDGQMDWIRIIHNETEDNPDRDGGSKGIGVKVGNYSRKLRRVVWRRSGFFFPCTTYDDFVKWMHREYRYLENERPESFGSVPFGKRCDEFSDSQNTQLCELS